MESVSQPGCQCLMGWGRSSTPGKLTLAQGSAVVGGKGDLSSTCLTTCYSCRQYTGGKNSAACLHLIPPCAATWTHNTQTHPPHSPPQHSIAIHNTRSTGKTLAAPREHTSLLSRISRQDLGTGGREQFAGKALLVRSDSPSMHSASLPNSSGSSLLPRSPRSEILRISGDSETFLIPRRPDKRLET